MTVKPYHPPPPKCGCCCCNVRTGSLSILCFEIIASLLEMSKNILYAIKYDEFMRDGKHSDTFKDYFKKEYLYASAAWHGVFALVALVGLVAVHKMKPGLVVPFLILQAIGIMLAVACGAAFIYILSKEPEVTAVGVMNIVGPLLGALVMLFFLWVVWKCYKWMQLCCQAECRRAGAVHPETRPAPVLVNDIDDEAAAQGAPEDIPGAVEPPEPALPQDVDLDSNAQALPKELASDEEDN